MSHKQPIVVSYGAGRDSTAMIIEMWKRGQRPDCILYANVGSEKAATYQFLPIFDRWLSDHDFPNITMVQYEPTSAPYRTIAGNCIMNGTLPGATFGKSSCTMKSKVEPQNKWTRDWAPARNAWMHGVKVVKLIGFECDEGYRLKRADAKAHSGKGAKDAAKYEYRHPLMEWGYNLGKCMEIIDDAGLPIPPKSACVICPNQKPEEVHDLSDDDRAIIMLTELSAEPYNTQVRGLWRRPRKSDGRPGSITEYILQQNLSFTPLTSLGKKVVLNPKCGKFKHGGAFTFDPPHVGPTLRSLLEAAGHAAPEFTTDAEGETDLWEEDCRSVKSCCSMEDETDQHLELVEAL